MTRRSAAAARPSMASIGSRRAARCASPSEPSANVFSQPDPEPRRAGPAPAPAAPEPLRLRGVQLLGDGCTRGRARRARRPRRAAGTRRAARRGPSAARQAARVVDGDDAQREQLAKDRRAARPRSRHRRPAAGRARDQARRPTRGAHRSGRWRRGGSRRPSRVGHAVVDARLGHARARSRAASDGRGPRARPAGPVPRARDRRRSASGRAGRGPSPPPSIHAVVRDPGDGLADAVDELVDGRSALERDPAPASAASARCRCASVRPGMATSSRREVDAARARPRRRASTSASEPAATTRPSRIAIASTQPGPARPRERRDPADHDEVGRACRYSCSSGVGWNGGCGQSAGASARGDVSAVRRPAGPRPPRARRMRRAAFRGRMPPPRPRRRPSRRRPGPSGTRRRSVPSTGSRLRGVHRAAAHDREQPAQRSRCSRRRSGRVTVPTRSDTGPTMRIGSEARHRHEHVEDAEHAAADVLGEVLLELRLRRDRDAGVRHAGEQGDRARRSRAATVKSANDPRPVAVSARWRKPGDRGRRSRAATIMIPSATSPPSMIRRRGAEVPERVEHQDPRHDAEPEREHDRRRSPWARGRASPSRTRARARPARRSATRRWPR